jgi:hypothetical protein
MPCFKRTADVYHDYAREVWYALGVIDGVSREFLGKPAVVTSLNDGTHKAGSLHYQGLAFDLRTRNMTPGETTSLFEKVKAILDPQGYDVIFEGTGTPGSSGTHIHCEFDPKPGQTFLVLVD